MLYQINAKGCRPYYTEGITDALFHYYALKAITDRVSLRRIPFAKAIYKALYK